jgi:anti-sigma regulatory factor (Ser/Thr protein kinase)
VTSGSVRISLAAEPGNVRRARAAITELARRAGLPEDAVEDVRLAVTEACTNVVRHAYPGGRPGTMRLEATAGTDAFVVVVSDRGTGIVPTAGTPGLGLGLPLLVALTRTLEIEGDPGGGTIVRLTFALPA